MAVNIHFYTAEQALEIIHVLPSLFPSTSAPPKRLKDASEALLHVLEVSCVKCCRIILTAVLKNTIEGALMAPNVVYF